MSERKSPSDYSHIPEAKWQKGHRKFLHSPGIVHRLEVMKLFSDTVSAHNLKHWLAMSALLGIYREGHLLRRDEDVDFFCFAEHLIPLMDGLKESLMAAGFDVRGYSNKGRLIAYMNGEEMALMGHWKKGKYRWFKNRRVPAHMFGGGTIEYGGRNWPCMSPIEEYLEWQYKNWKKPYYGNPEDRDKYMNKKKVKK